MAEKTMFDGQHADEEIIYVFRRHPIVLRRGLLFFLIAVLLGTLVIAIKPPDTLGFSGFLPLFIGLALGLVGFFHQWIGWYFSVFIITDQRFIQITQRGIFNRAVVDIGLDKVQNVNFQIAGIQETMLGFGTILLQTYVGDLVLDKIHRPAKVQERIVKIIKDLGYSGYGIPLENSSAAQKKKEEDN